VEDLPQMGFGAARLKSELRARRQSALVLVVAIAIAGGATLTALAGARRADSAVDRFMTYYEPTDGGLAADPELYPEFARLPQVAASATTARFGMVRLDAAGHPMQNDSLGEVAIDNPHLNRPKVLSGRLPDQTRSDEVFINASAARNVHLAVGATLRFRAFAPAQIDALLAGTNDAPTGPIIVVHVVGVGRFPSDLSPGQATPRVSYRGNDGVFFTSAFLQEYGERVGEAGGLFLLVRFHDARDAPAFTAAVKRLS
jgi:hypothetical protein